jgi:threonine dehydratase
MQLSDEQKKYGVITATTGNHGLALFYHCSQLGVPCVIVMPTTAALNKVDKCEKIGAKILVHGINIYEARIHALGIAKEKRMLYVNGYVLKFIFFGNWVQGIQYLDIYLYTQNIRYQSVMNYNFYKI